MQSQSIPMCQSMNRCWAFLNFATKYCLQILLRFLFPGVFSLSGTFTKDTVEAVLMGTRFLMIWFWTVNFGVFCHLCRQYSYFKEVGNAFEVRNNSHFSDLSRQCIMFHWWRF
jgi:hypothetical protein